MLKALLCPSLFCNYDLFVEGSFIRVNLGAPRTMPEKSRIFSIKDMLMANFFLVEHPHCVAHVGGGAFYKFGIHEQ